MSSKSWSQVAGSGKSLGCRLTSTERTSDCLGDSASDPAIFWRSTHVLASTISATASSKAGEVKSTVDMMA